MSAVVTRDEFDSVVRHLTHVTDKNIEKLDMNLNDNRLSMDVRFNETANLFDAVDARFDAVDIRFNTLESRMDSRFSALEAQIEKRFTSIERLLKGLAIALNVQDI